MARPITKCTVEACDRIHYGRGLCRMHYDRDRRHGHLDQTERGDPRWESARSAGRAAMEEARRQGKTRKEADASYRLAYMKEKGRIPGYNRKRNLLAVYGLTEDIAAGARCEVCGIDETANGRTLCIDHDHETGQVRGVLCHACNQLLGQAKDSPVILSNAINYLRRSKVRCA